MSTIDLPWPRSKARNHTLVPLFIPFAGCRTRCVYCAQNIQTGKDGVFSLENILADGEQMLLERRLRNLPAPEVAFFGGTFTGLDDSLLNICLTRVARWQKDGLIRDWRCSTRPDTLSPGLLSDMREAGCRCVELGIQSFSGAVLRASRRGYTPGQAEAGMAMVRNAKLVLGVQLLPGLPESSPSGFLSDVERSLELGAGFLRFYPCLVIRGTKLAQLWEKGLYRPWDLETTISTLASGTLMAQERAVPVIRIGVAKEPSLMASLLAGPWDAELGTRVMGRALLMTLERNLAGAIPEAVSLPRFAQGYLFGHRGEYASALAKLGITGSSIRWNDGERIHLSLGASD